MILKGLQNTFFPFTLDFVHEGRTHSLCAIGLSATGLIVGTTSKLRDTPMTGMRETAQTEHVRGEVCCVARPVGADQHGQ